MCSCVLGKRSSSFSSVIDVPPNVVVCNKRFLLFLVMVTNGHKVFKMCLTMNELRSMTIFPGGPGGGGGQPKRGLKHQNQKKYIPTKIIFMLTHDEICKSV